MEFSKDSELLTVINNSIDLLDVDDNKLIISFNNNGLNWSDIEFNNFIIANSNNKKLKEVIEEEVLEIISDNDDILNIKNMSNIALYCNSENYQSIKKFYWSKKKSIINNEINNLFDYSLNLSLVENKTFNIKPDNWNISRKKYIISKKIKYVDEINNIEYIVKLVKKNKENDLFNSLKESNIIKESQIYEFEVLVNNNIDAINILQSIINMLKYITLHPNILLKNEQNLILQEYHKLVKDDIKINSYNKKDFVPLLTPKPITLEKNNLIDPKEFGVVSILSGYTVTEKADGERLLMYVNDKGNIYLINNTYNIIDTGLISQSNLYNSLIDGEYVSCNKRTDDSSKNLFAAFDMYYIKGKNITNLPLIEDSDKKNSRYNYLKFASNYIDSSKSTIEFIVKKFYYNDDKSSILSYCNQILSNHKSYPYEIDGLIFTPSKLALYSYYSNKPMPLTDNVRWDRLFKWKPPDQNTIDFLVKFGKVFNENGQKYREIKLYVGYNSNQWEDIGPYKGLRLRYDHKYSKEQKKNYTSYKPTLFKPNIYYASGVEIAYVKIDRNGNIKTSDNDNIEDNSIVEFSYDNNDKVYISHRWNPLRVRDDKTRLYRKGEISKTMNDLNTAINVWRSIHNSVTYSMIMGNQTINHNNLLDSNVERILESGDVYYSRNIPRESLLSINMLNFHNQCIKKKLYEFSKDRNSLLELCGGEGGDMNRWLDYQYSFILSIDLVKQNIYNPRSGGYSRMLKRKNQYKRISSSDKAYFPDMVFAVGDCSLPINTGEAAKVAGDEESENILKIIMNRNYNNQHHLRHIAGKGANKFSVCSCQFAIHYFFQTEEKLNGFFSNVSTNLKKDGIFFATFMDGTIVLNELNSNGGDIIKGTRIMNDNTEVNTWAIIRRFEIKNLDKYGKQIGVFIENTQRVIPEFLVDLELLINKAKEFNLELIETNTFETDFNSYKENIDLEKDSDTLTRIEKDIIELDANPVQKKFSFFNRYVIMKKI
jgi:hypothetical protein|uniref:mRNA (guanine-N(7))-methyltransferase n=1 Tax=viral metagenome TaxID=1070528 RepID=A0A6C0JP37_9ZZZZ